jgi:hypothetical protein
MRAKESTDKNPPHILRSPGSKKTMHFSMSHARMRHNSSNLGGLKIAARIKWPHPRSRCHADFEALVHNSEIVIDWAF